jgi:hypothetical protein
MPPALRGTLNSEFTLNVDLAPTLLSAAGVDVPERMQGRDIAALYTGDYAQARARWRKDFFYEFSWTAPSTSRSLSSGRPAPAKSYFLSPNPPVYALVSKAYKVRARARPRANTHPPTPASLSSLPRIVHLTPPPPPRLVPPLSTFTGPSRSTSSSSTSRRTRSRSGT